MHFLIPKACIQSPTVITRIGPEASQQLNRVLVYRLSKQHVDLVAGETIGDGTPPRKLMAMLNETARHYIHRELQQFCADLVPPLFDVFAARHRSLL